MEWPAKSPDLNIKENILLYMMRELLTKVATKNDLLREIRSVWRKIELDRPLALRGYVTNASFKQWVGISLMPKIDRARKNYPTREIWEETHLREKFFALWFLNKVVWFAWLAAMLEGLLLPSNMAAKTTFCLYLVNRLIVALRCVVNFTTSSFQHFPWSLSAKLVFRKR